MSAAALYSVHLNRTISYDEAYTLRHYAVSPDQALLMYTSPNNHLLYSLLAWFSTTLGGTSLIVLRFPAFASTLLAVALAYRLGTRLSGVRAGVAAAVLLTINQGFADFATSARGYALTVLLTLVILDLLLFARNRFAHHYRYTLIFVSMALIITMPSMAVLIACVMGWLIVEWRQGRLPRRVVTGAMMPLIVGGIAAAFFYVPPRFDGAFADHFALFGEADLFRVLSGWLEIMTAPPVMGIALLVGLPVGWVVWVRNRKNRAALWGSLILIGGTLILALAQRVVWVNSFSPAIICTCWPR